MGNPGVFTFYSKCDRGPRGWHCTRFVHYSGPCALVPKWWNLKARWWHRVSL